MNLEYENRRVLIRRRQLRHWAGLCQTGRSRGGARGDCLSLCGEYREGRGPD